MIGPALPAIELGGLTVPLWAAADFDQTYDVIGPRPIMRMMSGVGVMQSHWQKLKTSLNGSGWMPAGFDGLDRTAQQLLKCAAPRTIQSASNAITLPAARRTDYTPGMTALMPGRILVETPSSLVGNVLTGTTVSGALAYVAWYWPQLTGYIVGLTTNARQGDAGSWKLDFEEV